MTTLNTIIEEEKTHPFIKQMQEWANNSFYGINDANLPIKNIDEIVSHVILKTLAELEEEIRNMELEFVGNSAKTQAQILSLISSKRMK